MKILVVVTVVMGVMVLVTVVMVEVMVEVMVVLMVSARHHANNQASVPQHALSHVVHQFKPVVQVLVQADALQAVPPHAVL